MKKSICNKYNLCWLILTIVSFLVINILVSLGVLNDVYQTVMMTIGINIILAISLNLIIGITGQFSLGHAGFMCIGAYAVGVCMKQMGGTLPSVCIGLVIGVVIAGLVSLVVAIPTLRLKGDYLAIATLGFGEIIRIVVLNMKITNGAAGLILKKVVTWPFIFVAMVLCTIVVVNFGRSAPGRACISVREDEIASESMGINTTKYKVLAFAIGAMIAAVAGGLYAGSFFVIKPDMFTYAKSIDILVIVVFGGMGSVTGSYIAATLIGLLNIFLQQFSSIRTIIYGAALVAIMVFRPKGILGRKEFTFSGLFKKFGKKEENA